MFSKEVFSKFEVISILFLVSTFIGVVFSISNDPYKTLGLGKYATNQEIRKVYKQLAKEWHPDKSNHPQAEAKFVEVKQAYELLIDTERRRIFDHYGITNEDSHFFKKQYDYRAYKRSGSEPFEDFFGQRFTFDEDISFYHKLTVTAKYFEQTIIGKSAIFPQILMFYSDWCFRCTRFVRNFKKIIEALEPLGIQFAAINAIHEQALVRKVGVNDIPSIILVLNGHSFVYRESSFTVQRIVEYIRRKMPYKLMQDVNDSNIQNFLGAWMDNKVRALVFEPKSPTRLRYLIVAYEFRSKVTFGSVQMNSVNCQDIIKRFKIHPKLDTLLIFNENIEHPVASLSMSDIPTKTFANLVSSNQYLALPRLSSQAMLEGICPAEWNRPRKRLCVILITENTESHNFARDVLRQMALQSVHKPERVRFAYIFKDKQADFINAISKGSSDNTLLRIVVIWRRDTSHIKYEWVSSADLNIDRTSADLREKYLNVTKQNVDNAIQRLLRSSEELSYDAFVKDLFDEHAQSFISLCFTKILYISEYLVDNIEKEHILASLSLLGTIAFMFAVGYVMVYLVRVEEENIKTTGIPQEQPLNKSNRYVPELKLHELRAEKYNGMVRLLKPGCRTIVLITDVQSRPKLIPGFHKAVWPYRKSKTLLFGHMLTEKGLSWYSELLRLSLSESRNIQINPRNCIGTVLALNGHRKYFCMFHAKHPETNGGAKRMLKMALRLRTREQDPEVGLFLNEVQNDSDNECESKILLEENLLDGLSNWLDRLFEGTTHRYYINYWPDFLTK